MGKHNFRNLRIWEKGMGIVSRTYDFTATLSVDERFGLISQANRSSVSIPSNIAEGSSKSSNKDFARFLEIALGSSYELETQLLICKHRKMGDQSLLEDVLCLLVPFQKSTQSFRNKILSEH